MSNRKYVIAKTGEEVKFGDIVAYKYEKETSFGTLVSYQEFTLTPLNIEMFIKKGIIKIVDTPSYKEDNLGYYITLAAKKMECSPEDLIKWLDKMNKVCSKAVLDFLLQIIAVEFYHKDMEGFNEATEYYSLKPKDGTVGKVNVTNAYIPLFKSREEAEKARIILKEQLELMYGKQKNC